MSVYVSNTALCLCTSGIQPWEDEYVKMAEAMGIDPKVCTHVRGEEATHTVNVKVYLLHFPSDKKVCAFYSIR